MTNREFLEKISNDVGDMKTELGDVKAELSDISRRTRRLEVLIENDIPKHIKIIAEQHGDIISELKTLNDYPETRGRVATLEHVVKAHTQDIGKLKKAVG